MGSFQAILLEKQGDEIQRRWTALDLRDLPPEGILIAVCYSSLNYKDALAICNQAPVVRRFPMIPGIDLCGVVQESHGDTFQVGDAVFATGWGLGESIWGGFAQMAKLKSEFCLGVPEPLSLLQTMQIGTAGFTAMLCVMALEAQGLSPGAEVLVTGATGGVGRFAITILAKLGYRVIASTGRKHAFGESLAALGASAVIDRLEASNRSLNQPRWAAAIDTVGGSTLASLLSQIEYGGSVAVCGLTGGGALPTSVYPFIIRGVNLLGIDSVLCPQKKRKQAWNRLASLLTTAEIAACVDRIIPLEAVPDASEQLLNGIGNGRIVVNCQA